MSKHDPAVTLRRLLECGRSAQQLCAGHTLETFMTDWKAMLALERVMELIGDSVKQLPLPLREQYPTVPWKDIAGMRDHLSHGKSVMMGNPIGILWNATHQDVPPLLAVVGQMLQDLEKPPAP